MNRVLREVTIAFKINLLDAIRNPLNTITMLMLYGFFYLIGYFLYGFTTNEIRSFQKYLVSGFIATSFLFQSTGWWSFIFGDLRFYGQLEEVILSYSSIELYFVGAFLYATIVTFISTTIALISIYLLFGFPIFAITIELFVVIGLFSILSIFFALLSNALYLIFPENWVVSNIVSYLTIVITPIFYPIEFLPWQLQYLGYLLPITWGAELLRSYMYGLSKFHHSELWVYFLISSTLWSFIAFYIWKKAFFMGKKTGHLYTP